MWREQNRNKEMTYNCYTMAMDFKRKKNNRLRAATSPPSPGAEKQTTQTRPTTMSNFRLSRYPLPYWLHYQKAECFLRSATCPLRQLICRQDIGLSAEAQDLGTDSCISIDSWKERKQYGSSILLKVQIAMQTPLFPR
jgi:hypothetical protein